MSWRSLFWNHVKCKCAVSPQHALQLGNISCYLTFRRLRKASTIPSCSLTQQGSSWSSSVLGRLNGLARRPTISWRSTPAVLFQSYSQRKWAARDHKSINKLLDKASKSINKLHPGEISALWSTIPRLLTESKTNHVTARGEEDSIKMRELQLNGILEQTIKSSESCSPKELASITLSLARIVQILRDGKGKMRKSIQHQAFGAILLDEHSNPKNTIIQPLAKASSAFLRHSDANLLTRLSSAYALLGCDPQFEDDTTFFGEIAAAATERVHDLDASNISSILSSFGTLGVSCPHLFRTVGDVMVAMTDLDAFTPQNISDIALAYATLKVKHPLLFQRIGSRITGFDDLVLFNPDDLSNIVWAYATLDETSYHGMFEMIGDSIIASKDLSLSTFKPRDLTNIVWAFATADVHHPSLFRKVGDAMCNLGSFNSFDTHQLSDIVWAFATQNEGHPRLFKKVGDSISFCYLQSISPLSLSRALWAFASLNVTHPNLFKNVGDSIVARNDLAAFTPHDLSNIVWAYAKLNERHPCFDVLHSIMLANDDMTFFSSQQLSNIVWAYARAGVYPELLKQVGDTILIRTDLASLNSQSLLNLVEAYAMSRFSHPVFKNVANAIISQADLNSLTPHFNARIVSGYASLNEYHPDLFSTIGEASFDSDELISLDAQSLLNILWAYTTANSSNPGVLKKTGKSIGANEYHNGLFIEIGDTLLASDELESFSSQVLSNIVWSFAASDHSHPLLLKRVGDIFVSRDNFDTLTPQNLSNLIWAYAKVDTPHRRLFQKIAFSITAHDGLSQFAPELFSNIVWAFATLEEHQPEMFKKIGDILRESDISNFTMEHLSNILWAFTSAKVYHPGLYRKVGDTLALREDLSDLTPGMFSNIFWAYVKSNASHSGLFKKLGASVPFLLYAIGDDIIASNTISGCTLEDVSGIMYAFAHSAVLHPGLFKEALNFIGAHDDMAACTSQALMNIAWAYAVVGFHANSSKFYRKLFCKIGDVMVARGGTDLKAASPVKLTRTVWAYAAMKIRHPGFFNIAGDVIADTDDLNEFTHHDVYNTVWAYDTVYKSHPLALFRKIADVIEALGGLGTFKSEHIAHMSRAFTVANVDAPLIFNDNFRVALHSKRNEFATHEMSLLHQWHLWQRGEKGKPGLPKSLQTCCHQAFVKSKIISSELQKAVVAELLCIGLNPTEEFTAHSGYRLDALVEANGKKIGVEIDGPYHFIGKKPNDRTLLKHRLVTANDGIQLISIPYWKWNKLGNDSSRKQKYLRKLLGLPEGGNNQSQATST